MKNKKFTISDRSRSFKYALNGIIILLTEEHNARIHVAFSIIAIVFGYFFGISVQEWIALIFSIGFVITIETLNTVMEHFSNFISPATNHSIKKIKDISAAAVLISASVALGVGLLIFIPKIILLCSNY